MSLSLCVFDLTVDAVGVVVRFTQKVRQRHHQRGQAGQQSSASDEPWPVDATPEETDKDDEDGVSHLDTHKRSESRRCCVLAQRGQCLLIQYKHTTTCIQDISVTDLIERSQESRLLAGEAVASLDGGDGALHVARHQQLRQLQQTVTQHEELQGGRGKRSG